MTLLITGHRGFVGRYLLDEGDAIGLVDANGAEVDITDPQAVQAALQHLRPDAVIHLAAQAFVPEAVRDPVGTYTVNFLGTQNLLAGLKAQGFRGRVLHVSSADVYGEVDAALLPITEATPARPLNPYAVSKLAGELLCDYFVRVEGLDIVVARPFNHIGPGQSPRFALADFSCAIAEMRRGRRAPELQVGDLDVTRDFTDVRDVVAAYRRLLAQGRRGEIYNVCSGVEHHLGTTVRRLAELAGVDLRVTVDPARLRPVSQRRSVGDASRLRKDTGWMPSIPFDQSLKDLLDHWDHTLEQ